VESNERSQNKWQLLENRSVSNPIEVMADERWERLAEQQGVAYAKTVAEAASVAGEDFCKTVKLSRNPTKRSQSDGNLGGVALSRAQLCLPTLR
jgi:hypothetical protein